MSSTSEARKRREEREAETVPVPVSLTFAEIDLIMEALDAPRWWREVNGQPIDDINEVSFKLWRATAQ
jgi:hypothetical protein